MIPDSNSYVEQRTEKAEEIRQAGQNPYDNQSFKDTSCKEFRELHKAVVDGAEADKERLFTIAGRIKLMRIMGKAAFATIEDESGNMQIYISLNNLGEQFEFIKKTVEVGDIIEAKGYGFLTKTGELTLHATAFKLLTKTIRPLPEKFHGLVDIELRYRQRYLDLIMNPDVKKSFVFRSAIIRSIRKFFESKGFLEVETPMLHPIPGGANARAFKTFHNALGVDRFLRIAPELYLKRLIVGGFEAVFEINRSFRNEGMDATHNPEFTMLEFYWAYKQCKDLIVLTEELFRFLVETLDIKETSFRGHKIDLTKPFEKYTYDEALVKIGGVDSKVLTSESDLMNLAKKYELKLTGKQNIGTLKAELFDHLVEDKLINPTFITDFPVEISPLARRKDNEPHLADRFELFIGGHEISNGFSELNDPIDQYNRFLHQVAQKDAGDDESMYMDEDYITALSYGMAPTAGQGIGIDRLVMLLTGNETIRDVLLFPAMRPQKDEKQNKGESEQ